MGEAWALSAEVLEQILAAEQAGAPDGLMPSASERMTVRNGVAVVPLAGILAKQPNLIMRILGATAYGDFCADLASAAADPDVKRIVLDVDSVGGTVSGVQTAMEAVRASAARKPVSAHVTGQCLSAAYWIASAAHEIYVSGATDFVGSIGVVAQHIDQRAADAAKGRVVTEIYAGRYKTVGSPHRALDDDSRAILQDRVDYLYGLFVRDVAQNRRVSESAALAFADGKTFVGHQAVKAGLVDGVRTLEQIMHSIPVQKPRAAPAGRVFTMPATRPAGAELIDLAKAYAVRHAVGIPEAVQAIQRLYGQTAARGFSVAPEAARQLAEARRLAFERGCSVAEILTKGA